MGTLSASFHTDVTTFNILMLLIVRTLFIITFNLNSELLVQLKDIYNVLIIYKYFLYRRKTQNEVK